jgi:restriction system protein
MKVEESSMRQATESRVPQYSDLIVPTFLALKALGGSGRNEEILARVILDMEIPNEIADIPHTNTNISELDYRLAWARTYLAKAGFIENPSRAVWAIKSDHVGDETVNAPEIVKTVRALSLTKKGVKVEVTDVGLSPEDTDPENDDVEFPEENKPWRERLMQVLLNMDAYGFERLTQRVLRECGFSNVIVTKKSGDGGIDGLGKWKMGGLLSFSVAFQCKKWEGTVGAREIRDFRGSLTTDIEKALLITTGRFTQEAKEEAARAGKQQIDLIDGEAFIDLITEYKIGVKPVTTYEIDTEFFRKI